jgi:tetratricopeptide (TPR) repeat protein
VKKPSRKPRIIFRYCTLTAVIAFGLGCGATWLLVKRPADQERAFVSAGESEPPLNTRLSSAQAAVASGNSYYDRKNWPRAIEAYEKAIALGTDNSDVRTDLGNAYRFSDQPQKALEQYEIAQKQDPQHENSLFNQGGLYAFSLNQPEKALEIWREYLARFPQSPNAPKTRDLISEVEAPQSDQRSEVARWLKNRTQPTPTPSVR